MDELGTFSKQYKWVTNFIPSLPTDELEKLIFAVIAADGDESGERNVREIAVRTMKTTWEGRWREKKEIPMDEQEQYLNQVWETWILPLVTQVNASLMDVLVEEVMVEERLKLPDFKPNIHQSSPDAARTEAIGGESGASSARQPFAALGE